MSPVSFDRAAEYYDTTRGYADGSAERIRDAIVAYTAAGRDTRFLELGELARAYKNSNKLPARETDQRDEMIDAAGDLMVYCLGLCEMLGVNSEDVLRQIVENNTRRSHTGWM